MVAGEIIAGPHVRDACQRHLDDIESGGERGLVWDVEAAEKAIDFFPEVLYLAGGEYEGEPFVLLPWEEFIVGSLFGWKREDGYRRFRVAYIETAKGSGKSPLAAGVGMKMLVADGEPRAEVYAAATKRDQAMILFRDAVAMVDQSPALQRRLTKSGSNPVWNLAYLSTGSFFRPISSDDSQSGPRVHCGLLDELHEHKSNNMVEMMRAGTKHRKQALIFMITNSGFDRTSVCFDQHEYGKKVSAQEITADHVFAYICAIDEGEDPLTDEADESLGFPPSWAKTNPSLEYGLPGVKYLREQVTEARGMPAKESVVRRLNFCQWVDAASPWIDGDLWRRCEVEDLELPAEGDLYLALDLSGKLDLTSLAAVCPDGDGFQGRTWFWTPGETVSERENRDRVPYRRWIEAGHLQDTPGRSIDYAVPAGLVAELFATGRVRALAFDPYRMADFARELDDLGVPWQDWEGPGRSYPEEALVLVKHGQGFGGGASPSSLWMPHSIDVLETAIVDERLQVRKNPVLTWNSASAVLTTDAQGNQKWEKRKSTGRIDGIVALSMAAGAADVLANETETGGGWLA